MKCFISYSHIDGTFTSNLVKQLKPLIDSNKIDVWLDRHNWVGSDFLNRIDFNLSQADIALLLISPNYFSSNACMDEMREAIKFKKNKNLIVVPIILQSCAWTEYAELSNILAAPTDGKPVATFSNEMDGWLDVISNLKVTIELLSKQNSIKFTQEFESFLQSTEMLTQSHSKVAILKLDDIYAEPILTKYDSDDTPIKIPASELFENLFKSENIIIAGERQSGKTSMLKKIIPKLKNNNFLPVYISGDDKYRSNLDTLVSDALIKQYGVGIYDIHERERIIPVLDDVHNSQNLDIIIKSLSTFQKTIVVVDEVFGLNINNQIKFKNFEKFKIRPFLANDRDRLIRKWLKIGATQEEVASVSFDQEIDKRTEVVETFLGTLFGKGIVPQYPFFILTILSTYETQKPLDHEITTQGYCYQSLIYFYLRKAGVQNDRIGSALNYLTELGFAIYTAERNQIDIEGLDSFNAKYKSKYNVEIPFNSLLKILSDINIFKLNGFGFYTFTYHYLYYFFAGKYFSENLDANKKRVNHILSNLHVDEFAYIAIFIAHHTKSNYLLDELLLNAEILFEYNEAATLDRNSMEFFDKQRSKVIQSTLPNLRHEHLAERERRLNEKSIQEELKLDSQVDSNENSVEDKLATTLRLAFKTVEVMGMILKNRSGSLERPRLKYIFEQGVNVHLRLLNYFFNIIGDEDAEQQIVDYLLEKIDIDELEGTSKKKLSEEEIKDKLRKLYWNMNIGIINGILSKAVNVLGSDRLLRVCSDVANENGSPAFFIIESGIKMWYGKKLDFDELLERSSQSDFSFIGRELLKFRIADYASMHKLSYAERQRLESKFQISAQKTFINSLQNKTSN